MNFDEIMELICDRCHYPYIEAQEHLDELCEACPIAAMLQNITKENEHD